MYFLTIVAAVLVWGCGVAPGEPRPTGSSSSSGDGGSGGDVSDGGGGSDEGGAPPEFRKDCSDVPPNHFVVKVWTSVKPTGHIGIDGWKAGSPWGNLWIEPDPESKTTVWDDGEHLIGDEIWIHIGLGTGETWTNDLGEEPHNVPAMCGSSGYCNFPHVTCYGTDNPLTPAMDGDVLIYATN